MKNFSIIIIVILVLIIAYLLYDRSRSTCYYLPTDNPNPDFWGRHYWAAIHSIADRIPCSACHDDGKSLFVFSHDLTNIKTGKKIFSLDNFKLWQDRISKIKVDKDGEYSIEEIE